MSQLSEVSDQTAIQLYQTAGEFYVLGLAQLTEFPSLDDPEVIPGEVVPILDKFGEQWRNLPGEFPDQANIRYEVVGVHDIEANFEGIIEDILRNESRRQ